MLGGRHAQRSKPPAGARVDWSHPFARGLAGCWLLNEGAGLRCADLTGHARGSVEPTTGGYWVGPEGLGVAAGAGRRVVCGTHPATRTPRVSVLARVLLGFPGTHSRIAGCGATVNTTQGWDLWSNEGTPQFAVGIGGTASRVNGIAMSTEKWVNVLGTYGDGLQAVYQDGRPISSTAKTGSIAYPATQQMVIGNLDSTIANQPFAGRIAAVMVWNRGLAPAEAAAVSADPYGFLLPPVSSRSWFLPGASPPPPPASAFVAAFAPGF